MNTKSTNENPQPPLADTPGSAFSPTVADFTRCLEVLAWLAAKMAIYNPTWMLALAAIQGAVEACKKIATELESPNKD